MNRSEVVDRLRFYLETQFASPGATLSDTTDLLEDWFVDSLGIVQTVMFIETEFKIAVSRADINGDNFKSVSTLADFVTRQLS